MLDVKLKRGPQVILPKDASLIAGFTGLGAGDKVIDTGAGSGWLTVFLGNIVGEKGHVYSYEKRPEFAELAEKNVKKAGLEGVVEIKVKDAALGFDETEIDLVTLDCADSDLLLPNAFAALRKGGWCVGYVPHVEQAKKFVLAGEAAGFFHVRTIEAIVREWLVRERGCRPENTGLVHTGFLSFLRKP
ncbi:tRNA (adenine(57)-N(1)/adenine(58)-N(1))-methyltransferase TrmI [Candidatus Norongarragalina meridionalis]|nr:tRNA (adenine(57)-N(1)/adenine(58)-N(1))-methyltransferase TrmI [Candidatus Norongarragalina meridionalis]